MDIIYEPDITYRRALQIDKMWADSDAGGKLCSEVLNMASLKGNERVLDVAAATGCLLELLAEALPDGHAIGVDRSAAMVRLAQAKLVKGKTERASVVYSEGQDRSSRVLCLTWSYACLAYITSPIRSPR